MKERLYGESTLSDCIHSFLKQSSLDKQMYEQLVISHWKDIVGEHAAEHTVSLFIKDKALHVKLNNSCWRNELHYRKQQIIQKINAFVNYDLIGEVHVY
ncbi:MAG: DUF721 domain-containing protein [Bacteroidia bacterium]|nr:DUF721 domain-containing protein [Bacteroidia bacterium]MDW8301357.1 DUF721 domain-containing protein [Bacteroidia bacterium]